MNKAIIGAAVAGLIVAGAGIGAWAQSDLLSRGTSDNAAAAESSSRRASSSIPRVVDLDGMRTITFVVSNTEGFFQFVLPEGCNIDMGTMIISNGLWSAGNDNRFGMGIFSQGSRIASATSNEFGTTAVNFPKPLKLRAGTHAINGYLGPTVQGAPLGPVEVSFIGTVPAANVDSLSVH